MEKKKIMEKLRIFIAIIFVFHLKQKSVLAYKAGHFKRVLDFSDPSKYWA